MRTIAYGTEPQQFGELALPATPGPYPVAILLHGGFWRNTYGLDLMRELANDLTRHGFASWNIEYRRVGDPGGGWPGTFEDIARATDFLQHIALEYALDTQRIYAIGHSAGGHLALWLAARPKLNREQTLRLKGVVSQAGAADLEEVWRLHLSNDAVVSLLGGSPEEVPERYAFASPANLLPLGVPTVLLHGLEDIDVPPEISRRYYEKARIAGDNALLIELPGVEHLALIDTRSDAWQKTVSELLKLLP
ncbi:acetyl esterase/lipase [Thermosporothrix hazakensis]|jgi:acetyl esterase/lipase|uniref:Acetyl esterase/lipase n=2 Tax=Thermosporothrix TaxID=768650 RepID=A0A326UTF4_THEHA|nr:alpha/beta hydrolase [Thermosporothrix hazakensis]PZW35983.1 acetyl esterase/lipase [Thermosporothrix hazakensis]BBH88451.1 hypothetical protein KTC_32020 [Thermosporothrix sp. COM3]GCE46637.1 hypothetical protein KTH_15060 [Thermosporothrix hazakensis]